MITKFKIALLGLAFFSAVAFADGNSGRNGLYVTNTNASGVLNYNSTGTLTLPNTSGTLLTTGGGTSTAITNDTSTGTVLNELAVIESSGDAITASTSNLNGIIGLVSAGAGTTGSATINQIGVTPCVFDGATTAGDFVQASTTMGGKCHDTGSASVPSNGNQVIGQVLSTNGSGGTYNVFLIIDNSPVSVAVPIPYSSLATEGNNSVLGNISGGSAVPSPIPLAPVPTVSPTTTPSMILTLDTNSNMTANALVPGYATTATAASTTTLTVASAQIQTFTGTSLQTVQLPTGSTLKTGWQYLIENQSTGAVTIKNSAASTQCTLNAVSSYAFTALMTLTNNSGNGTWQCALSYSGPSDALPVPYGGTGLTSGTSGGIPYFNASNTIASSALLAQFGVLLGGGLGGSPTNIAVPSTANEIFMSGSASTPAWSTSTWPATTTANDILYSSSTNTVGQIATVNDGILATNSSGVPSVTPSPSIGVPGTSAGSLIFGSTGSSFATTVQPAPSPSPAVTFQLPPNNGSSNFYLQTDGSGHTSWATATPSFSGLTQWGILYAATSSTLGETSACSSGQVPMGNGAGAPTCATVPGNSTILSPPTSQILTYNSGGSTFTGNRTSGSPTLSTVSSFSGLYIGLAISGTGIPGSAYILAMNTGASTITMSANASSGSGTSTTVTPSSTAGTYVTPTPTPLYLHVMMVGGGGGGSGSSSSAANNPVGGGNGGNTTFGSSLLIANGGSGTTGTGGGGGGTATVNSPGIPFVVLQGSSGFGGAFGLVNPPGGAGGSTPWGQPGSAGGGGGGGNAAGLGGGSGGQGGGGASSSTAGIGGGGGGAGGYVEADIPSPSATYAFTVGAGGTNGTAGTLGFNGGSGGAAQIIVEARYQ